MTFEPFKVLQRNICISLLYILKAKIWYQLNAFKPPTPWHRLLSVGNPMPRLKVFYSFLQHKICIIFALVLHKKEPLRDYDNHVYNVASR